jgi:hypothetical protein
MADATRTQFLHCKSCWWPALADQGRYIAFATPRSFDQRDRTATDVYRYDRRTGKTVWISRRN